jgi:hypothetical protein
LVFATDLFRARLDATIDSRHPLELLRTKMPRPAIDIVQACYRPQALPARRVQTYGAGSTPEH